MRLSLKPMFRNLTLLLLPFGCLPPLTSFSVFFSVSHLNFSFLFYFQHCLFTFFPNNILVSVHSSSGSWSVKFCSADLFSYGLQMHLKCYLHYFGIVLLMLFFSFNVCCLLLVMSMWTVTCSVA